MLDMPKYFEWFTYHEWTQKYGDVAHISVFGQPIIVLGSHAASTDVLVRKAAISSDRPVFTMGGKMVGWDNAMPLLQYHDRRLKKMRRISGLLMGTRSSTHLWDVEEHLTRRLIKKIYNDMQVGDSEGRKLPDRIRWLAAAIILRITHGYAAADEDDPLVNIATEAMKTFGQSVEPGVWAVDFIPALRHLPSWFPFTNFQKISREWSSHVDALSQTPLDFVKKQMSVGTAPFSLARALLDQAGPDMDPQEEFEIKWTTTSLYGAGADTTAAQIYFFFLLMILHPEVQRRAQSELDKVLCGERLPSLRDRQDGVLPYVDVLVKELIRFSPVVPANTPHVMTEEAEYRGWRIPKGAIVIANLWGISRDPLMYPNPDIFRPERFLTKAQGGDCETVEDIQFDPAKIIFGYGRRSCPGQILAELSVWSAVALCLAVFQIDGVKGEEPSPYDQEPGIITHPKAFKCRISVRSTQAQELLNSIPDHDVTAWMHPWPKKSTFNE
ncbi:cytochrome P450 [Sistotremastrum niveocremeum HHB9708]|uniref:Cytochrome P450 n=1 Tax=Sistotremastrum niveocremeum HHB9708 TaxID=1314777 RepID=A0A164S1R1_9AGAM|nr:cytochrome P450 [Sistotremastrum niveocremeum HHB9708]